MAFSITSSALYLLMKNSRSKWVIRTLVAGLLGLYVVGLYLAKTVVAMYLGSRLFGSGQRVVGILVGLLILTVVGEVPYVGGILGFIVLIMGLGALTLQLIGGMRSKTTG